MSITKCTVPIATLTQKPFLLGSSQVYTRVTAENLIGQSLPSVPGTIYLDLELPSHVIGSLSFGRLKNWNEFFVNPSQSVDKGKLSAIAIKQK